MSINLDYSSTLLNCLNYDHKVHTFLNRNFLFCILIVYLVVSVIPSCPIIVLFIVFQLTVGLLWILFSLSLIYQQSDLRTFSYVIWMFYDDLFGLLCSISDLVLLFYTYFKAFCLFFLFLERSDFLPTPTSRMLSGLFCVIC